MTRTLKLPRLPSPTNSTAYKPPMVRFDSGAHRGHPEWEIAVNPSLFLIPDLSNEQTHLDAKRWSRLELVYFVSCITSAEPVPTSMLIFLRFSRVVGAIHLQTQLR